MAVKYVEPMDLIVKSKDMIDNNHLKTFDSLGTIVNPWDVVLFLNNRYKVLELGVYLGYRNYTKYKNLPSHTPPGTKYWIWMVQQDGLLLNNSHIVKSIKDSLLTSVPMFSRDMVYTTDQYCVYKINEESSDKHNMPVKKVIATRDALQLKFKELWQQM